jgi:molybdate transport system ATP-binding protein
MTTLSLNLDVQYPSFQLKADCTVSDQGITGLYGPSGSGKSSLLRAIAGLTQSHGTITLGDTVWQTITSRRLHTSGALVMWPKHRNCLPI